MLRNIIKIEEDKCNGCGICVTACHEGAIQLIDGKAKLVSASYCDGLGNCLPECPTGAITMEQREAANFDEKAVEQNIKAKSQTPPTMPEKLACGCPGTQARTLHHNPLEAATTQGATPSQLRQWPVQIKLVPVHAPYLENAHLLIAADCAAYAYSNMHNDFMKNKITLIGCPKLDEVDYSEKLTEILLTNDIKPPISGRELTRRQL